MFNNFWHESWSRFDDAFKTFDSAFDNKPSAEPVVTGITEVRLVFKGVEVFVYDLPKGSA